MLIKEVFWIHGLPASIVSDRGPQFIVTVWKSFCKRLGIQAKLSTAFHLETDGQFERSNQDVERHLRTYCSYLQDDWVKWLPIAEFADNNAVSASTGVSPFYANKGFDPRMSFGPDTTDYTSTRQRLDAARAEDITDKIQNILDFVRQNLDIAQIRMAEQANKHRKDVTFKVGDMVFLSNKNINTERPSRKLDNKKWGPFKIIELIGSSYRLELPSSFLAPSAAVRDKDSKPRTEPGPSFRHIRRH